MQFKESKIEEMDSGFVQLVVATSEWSGDGPLTETSFFTRMLKLVLIVRLLKTGVWIAKKKSAGRFCCEKQ